MKILLNTAILLACSSPLFAQTQITKADFAKPGDTLFYAVDSSLNTLNLNTGTGTNVTWDFTATSAKYNEETWFLNPNESPVDAPDNITHVMIDGEIDNVSFFDITDAGLYSIQPNPAYSFLGGEAFFRLKGISFPFEYHSESKDSFTSVSVVDANNIMMGNLADSVRVTISVSVHTLCDGSGTLKTPYKTYENALRLKTVTVARFKIEGKSNALPFWVTIPNNLLPINVPEKQTDVSYAWLQANSGYFITEVLMLSDTSNQSKHIRWQTSRPSPNSALYDITKNSLSLNAYPNPANNQLNIGFDLTHKAMVEVSLFDVTGKKVYAQTFEGTSGTNTCAVSTQNIPSGLYHAVIQTNGTASTLKVNVNH
jgi:hypothetical protein